MNQSLLFEADPADRMLNLLPVDGYVQYHPEFMSPLNSAKFMRQLQDSLVWEHDQLIMFGKTIATRRKVAWVGDPQCSYTYSGIQRHPQAWTSELLLVKSQLEAISQAQFNSCLLNLYYDGNDGMGWHSDNEKELDAQSPIASLSLGAERKFAFRHKKDKTTISFILGNGSALLMHAPTQQFWQHALIKSKIIVTPRINLTFRKINVRDE